MDFNNRFGDGIKLCEVAVGYIFVKRELCAEALNASADGTACYNDGHTMKQLRKNDRLAVYGDTVADSVLCHRWYSQGYEKGVWDSMRKESLCNRNLAERGFSHQLDVCIIKNGGTVCVSEKMMATAVEAILGAVHLDGGLDALTTVMGNLGIIDPLRESCTDLLRSTYVEVYRSMSRDHPRLVGAEA
ncbi:Ribonuclease 3 [Metarhizium anisopliae]|nr:Ribonuclease 3 [Metarhizium anisopliae]